MVPQTGSSPAGGTHPAKLLSLEAGRFFAAASVLLYHYGSLVEDFRGASPFADAFRWGHAGVPFFFVLSGFVIHHVHARDVGQPDRVRRFVIRRAIRLYPMFWLISLAMLAGFLLVPGLAGERRIDAAGVVADLSLLPHGNAILPISWTLRHEMLFYALFALMIWRGWAMLALILVWIVASLILGQIDPPDLAELGRWSVVAGTLNLGFALGMLVSMRVAKPSRVPPALLAGVGLAIIVILAAIEWGVGRGTPHSVSILGDAGDLGYLIGSAFLILGLVRAERAGWRMPGGRWWIPLGGASYVLYLLHQPLGSVAMRGFAKVPMLNPEAVFVMAAGGAILGATLLHLWVERPLLAMLGARFTRPRAEVRAPA